MLNPKYKLSAQMIADAIADAMQTIREDVKAGRGADIEADAVLCTVEGNLLSVFSRLYPDFDKREFSRACDLIDLIPSEAFDRC